MFTTIPVTIFSVGPDSEAARWMAYQRFSVEPFLLGVPFPMPVGAIRHIEERSFHRGYGVPAHEAHAYVIEALFAIPVAS